MSSSPRIEVRRRLPWLVGAVVLVLVAVTAWLLSSSAPPQTAEEEPAQLAADGSVELSDAQISSQGIESAPVTAATQLPLGGLPAQIIAPLDASTQVVAPYASVVTRIIADEGTSVRQGQPLARLQSRDLLMAQGDLARARSEALAATQQARRDADLLAEGIISASRNEQAQARASAAEAARRQAEGALSQLRLVRDGQPGEYELLAPLSGQVLRRLVAPGQAVMALEPAFVVAESGVLDVTFTAPVRVRGALVSGLEVRLPGSSVARVVAVGADADPASQSLRVRARLASSEGQVVGQQFSVTLLLPAPADSLAVPTRALLRSGQSHVLYRKEGRRISAVPVQELLGGDETTSIVRASGLKPGAEVVTRGTALLKSLIPAE